MFNQVPFPLPLAEEITPLLILQEKDHPDDTGVYAAYRVPLDLLDASGVGDAFVRKMVGEFRQHLHDRAIQEYLNKALVFHRMEDAVAAMKDKAIVLASPGLLVRPEFQQLLESNSNLSVCVSMRLPDGVNGNTERRCMIVSEDRTKVFAFDVPN